MNTFSLDSEVLMNETEAREKICPIHSNPDRQVNCLASDCMFWVKYATTNKGFDSVHRKINETVFLYNGTEKKTIIEGNCSIILILEKLHKGDKIKS